MNEIIQFLNDCGTFFLATEEGGQPRVRPLGFVMDYNGKLAFCTNNQKPMFKQMKANPRVELSACKGPDWVRIAGKVSFITDEASQKKALEVMPDLAGMYAVGDGKFEIFAFEGGTATFASMKGGGKTVEL